MAACKWVEAEKDPILSSESLFDALFLVLAVCFLSLAVV